MSGNPSHRLRIAITFELVLVGGFPLSTRQLAAAVARTRIVSLREPAREHETLEDVLVTLLHMERSEQITRVESPLREDDVATYWALATSPWAPALPAS